MLRKHKRLCIIGAVCLCILLLAAALSPFIAVSSTPNEGGGCIAVVFDKASVMGADRIILREGDKVITITDKETVREIASAFVVANRTDLCGYHKDTWMEIYNGDTLVRNIHWNDHDELAEVYKTDATHWIWPSTSQIGQVLLSDDLVEKLEKLLETP